jgi:hypothetical protein
MLCELAYCIVCNGSEGELTTHCPGFDLPIRILNACYQSGLNYKDDEWYIKNEFIPYRKLEHNVVSTKCEVCKLSTQCLTSECCGHNLDSHMIKAISESYIDFVDGKWEVAIPISHQRKLANGVT